MSRIRSRRTPLLVASTLLALLLATVIRPAMASDHDAPRGFASATAAIQAAIERDGGHYAGDCAATISPHDLGKVCSRPAGERQPVRAYLLGRTFSEFDRWAFVAEDAAGGWQIVAVVTLDFLGPPEPPWPH